MLKVWLPLNGDLHNQGLSDVTVTNNGATVNNSGKIGKCYEFDGNAHWLQFDQPLGDLYNNDYTIAVWLKPMDSTRSIIFSEYAASGASGVALELTASRGIRVYWNGSPDIYVPGPLPLDTWSHIAVVKTDGKIDFYVNGSLTYTYTGTLSNRVSNAAPRLGDDYRGGTSVSYKGCMNDFRLYSHALSTKEVKELSKGLVLHYPLNRGGFGADNYALASDTEKSNKNSNNIWTLQTGSPTELSGNTVTVSADIKCTVDNVSCDTYFRSSSGMVGSSTRISGITTEYKRYSATFKATTSTNYISISFRNNGNVSGANTSATYYYKNVKVELGNHATPWIPNPTDDLYSALGLDDGVEYDVSGYGNNGTQIGSLTADPDTPKYSVSTHFNGSSTIKNTNFLFTNGQWTISFWYKFTTAPSSTYQGFICLSRSDGSDSNKKFAAMPRDSLVWFKFESSSYAMYSRKTNEWCHIAMVCDETKGYIYQNGALIKTIDSVGNILTDCDDLVIGARASSSDAASTTLYLNGNMSDVRIYSTALSADDILALYNTPASIASNGTLLTQGEISEV